MEKLKIYFFESNISMHNTYYLPYVSGLLTAYSKTFPVLDNNYSFEKFIFMRDTPDNMMKPIVDPFMVAFSVCIWNYELSKVVAKKIKEKYPNCYILFGGCHINKDTANYPFIDSIIEHEGERKFVELLHKFINEPVVLPPYLLDHFLSPYVIGLYDYLFIEYPNVNFQVITETNRGCPFTCAFCYWGQNFEENKVKYHSIDYVRQEAEWIGRNKIKYVFLADANLGQYKQDQEIAQIYVDTKLKYKYPERVRVCYGKNREEEVFKTAKILHQANLSKAVTLARQSNDEGVLDAIKRKNIKLSVYDNLARRYAAEGIPTYSEIILGLPGETKESFIKGVEEIINSPTSLFIYHCTILPNTEMHKSEYIAKHGIRTVRVPLTEIHGEIRKPEYVTEYEDIVVATATMPMADWIECAVYSWTTQLRCVFGIDNIAIHELARFHAIAENITNGYSRGQVDQRFGNVYLEPEEAAFCRISLDRGEATGDLVEWCKHNVIWGRKSRVQKVKTEV